MKNLKNMFMVAILTVFCLATFGISVSAQRDTTQPSATLKDQITKAETLITKLESITTTIERTGTITDADVAAFDEVGYALGETLYAAFQQSAKSTLEAAQSNGTRGNAQDLVYFESFESNFVGRTEAVVAKFEEIEKGVSEGSIVDRTTSTSEKVKVNAVNPTKTTNLNSVLIEETSICGSTGNAGTKLLIPCIAPCVAKNWVACAACIIEKVPEGIGYYNQFVNCWNGCRPGWRGILCRARCLATFLYWVF